MICRFFNTKKGCKYGSECRFKHIIMDKRNIIETKTADNDRLEESTEKISVEKPNDKSTTFPVAAAAAAASTKPPKPPKRTPIEKPKIDKTLEMKQLETRFRSSFFMKDDVTLGGKIVSLNLPITDPDFPYDIQVLELDIRIPMGYPIEPGNHCTFAVKNTNIPDPIKDNIRVRINLISREASLKSNQPILQSLLNWLDRNLESLLILPTSSSIKFVSETNRNKFISNESDESHEDEKDESKDESHEDEKDESHKDDHENEKDESKDESHEKDESKCHKDDDQSYNDVKKESTGFKLILTDIQLHQISLLEPLFLSFSVSCNRCKETIDLQNISPDQETIRICKKCKTGISIRYHGETLFSSKTPLIATFTVCENCEPLDLLTSSFMGTCVDCLSHQMPFKNVIRGFPVKVNCSQCFRQMTLKIDNIVWQRNFLAVRTSSNRGKAAPFDLVKPITLKSLGVTPGNPLPSNGTCKHYKKSFRWLRFPCCGKVYPCDICHDEKKGDNHTMKFANRMICGFCSKEQGFSSKPCINCGKELTASSSSTQFWEGGKGTRDQSKMSKKDAHKYRGLSKQTK